MTATLANGGNQERRRDLDFYPTPPDVTLALVNFLNLRGRRIWEPACGDGAMCKVLAEAGNFVLASDIASVCHGHGGMDFLAKDLRNSRLAGDSRSFDAIVTNPPFNISEQFIRHALTQAPLVAMVLKSQYWHAAKRRKLFADHPPAWVLALTWRPDFMAGERGGAPTMDCIWTVWQEGVTDTRYRQLARP